MYALWHGSALGDQGYPSHLALWSRAGTLIDELPLDSLDLPLSLLSTMVRELGPNEPQRIAQLSRVPGVHYVLLARVTQDEVMTASVGPRSQLVTPGRIGRLLEPARAESPLYRLTLSPPSGPTAEPPRPRWRREGWLVRNEYPLLLPSGARVVHAAVDLRGPLPLLVRGVLVVLLDAAVLGALWFLAEVVSGARPPRPRWRSLSRSFRIRLAATLAAFFIVPAVGFAAWSFTRLNEEVERSRDLLITQTLRDAAITAGGSLTGDSTALNDRLRELSRRIDADLTFYEGGRLMGSSTDVLKDLGVMPQLMDPVAFTALAMEGELEVTRDGSIPRLRERVGYRVVQPGFPEALGVLATPQLAEDASLAVRRLDLALVLLLGTLLGVGAALAGAGRASRALSRPVADLRRSAIALGKGDPMPPYSGSQPLEFEPVFGAFEPDGGRHPLQPARAGGGEEAHRVGARHRGDRRGRARPGRPGAHRQSAGGGDVGGRAPGGVVLPSTARSPVGAAHAGGAALPPGSRCRISRRAGGRWAKAHPAARAARARRAWRRDRDQRRDRPLPGRASAGVGRDGAPGGPRDQESAHADAAGAPAPAPGLSGPAGELRSTLEETAERMLAEIDRLDTIARAFSRFAAPEAGDQPLDRVDLGVAVGEVVQLYRLAEEGCEVELEREPRSYGAARVDEVKEVVVNLLENARNADAKLVRVRVRPGAIEVSDDGTGIPADLLPRIFEPRFSTTTSGSGLGLAIVKRLVEGWGGRIEVESEVGRGTRIVVILQLRET